MIWAVNGRDGEGRRTVYFRCNSDRVAEAEAARRGLRDVVVEPRFPNAVPPDATIEDVEEALDARAILAASMIIQRPILTIVIGVVLGNIVFWTLFALIFGGRSR